MGLVTRHPHTQPKQKKQYICSELKLNRSDMRVLIAIFLCKIWTFDYILKSNKFTRGNGMDKIYCREDSENL